MKRIELFNNLVVMAAVDGKISDEEAALLAQRAMRWGITEAEAMKVIHEAMSSHRSFAVPPTKEQCLEVLREIVQMMSMDGTMTPKEKSLCAQAAVEMRITPQEFKNLLASMT